MIRTYTFFDGGSVKFDDKKSVKELIEYAFSMFGFYEPMGIDIVTVFQAHNPATNTGWFTTDVSLSCAEEIKNCNELCFAYFIPNVFYFAEGGWGHHMTELGNHPHIPNAISLNLQFDDFKNTIVVNGKYSFSDIIQTLKNTGYIDDSCRCVEVVPIGCARKSYVIPFSDSTIRMCLLDFEKALEQYNAEHIKSDSGDSIYHIELRIC